MNLKKTLLTVMSGCGAMVLFGGCASIMCGPKQAVSIGSDPAGAEVLVYDSHGEVVFTKSTPCVAQLERGTKDYEHAEYVVLIRKEGYAPVQIHLNGSMNRAYLINFVNVVGLGIDPLTRSMWTLHPASVDAELLSDSSAFFEEHKHDLFVRLQEQEAQGLTQVAQPEAQ